MCVEEGGVHTWVVSYCRSQLEMTTPASAEPSRTYTSVHTNAHTCLPETTPPRPHSMFVYACRFSVVKKETESDTRKREREEREKEKKRKLREMELQGMATPKLSPNMSSTASEVEIKGGLSAAVKVVFVLVRLGPVVGVVTCWWCKVES